MTINNLEKKVVSTAVAVSLLMPNIALAEQLIMKEETVYVDLEEDGRAKEIISSIWIHSEDEIKKIEDKTNLKNIVNIKGEEKPKITDGKALWEVNDKDLYYQGDSDKSLPIDADIEYILDGKKVNPEDILGESGKLKIKINFKNKDMNEITLKNGKKKMIYSPYIVATVVDLPMENFENIKINKGKILSDGSNDILSFISIPGLRDSLDIDGNSLDLSDSIEINADVVDFEMKPIIMAITTEIPELDALDKANDIDSLIDGLEEFTDASDKLTEATAELYDGQLKLDSGLKEFGVGVDKLSQGSKELLGGTDELSNGIDSAYKGSLKLKDGGNSLGKSSEELGKGYEKLGNGMTEFSNKSGELADGAKKLSEGISSIPENLKKLAAGMKDLITNTDKLKDGQNDLTKGLEKSLIGAGDLKNAKIQEKEGIETLIESITHMERLADEISNMEGGGEISAGLSQALAQQKEALNRLNGSSGQIILGLEDLESGLKDAKSGSSELESAIKAVNTGQVDISEGLNQLSAGTEEINSAANELSEGSDALKDGSREIAGNTEKLNNGFSQLSEGTNKFVSSTDELSLGLKSLNEGSLALKKGVLGLSDGSHQLSNASGQLIDGSNKLTDGTGQLNEGMNKFVDEGISKIEDKLENGDLDIGEILEIKDELIRLSKENKSFSGIDEKMDGKLKYIMKTQGIKMDKIEEVEEIEEKEDENFFKKILGKIK